MERKRCRIDKFGVSGVVIRPAIAEDTGLEPLEHRRAVGARERKTKTAPRPREVRAASERLDGVVAAKRFVDHHLPQTVKTFRAIAEFHQMVGVVAHPLEEIVPRFADV